MNSLPFYRTLEGALRLRGASIEDICPNDDPVARRVLHDYGAMFVGADVVMPPPCCVFTNEDQVAIFQKEAGLMPATIGEAGIELQPAARPGLLQARAIACAHPLGTSPAAGGAHARLGCADAVQ